MPRKQLYTVSTVGLIADYPLSQSAPKCPYTQLQEEVGLLFARFAANQTAEQFVLGAEASGTVVAVGEGVETLKVLLLPHFKDWYCELRW